MSHRNLDRWFRSARQPLTLAVVCGLALLGCGDAQELNDYSSLNRTAFVTACVDISTDSQLVRDVCECTWDAVEEGIPYDEVVRIDQNLRVDALASLPDPVARIMADCLIEESNL